MKTYAIITYGCQMNQSDSEKIAKVLEKNSYQPAGEIKNANLIIINACSVRQSAVHRVYSQIHNLKKISGINNLDQTFILAGCVLEADKKKLAEKFDFILDAKDLIRLPDMLNTKYKIQNPPSSQAIMLARPPSFKIKPTIYIPISTGCNNYCSYCVVPKTRGPECSRPAEEIINEAKNAIANGAKEIFLLGQNVNSYHSPFKPDKNKIDFPSLLKLLSGLNGKFWIKFISSHPKDLSNELIETIAKNDKICEYIHLPAQSGDDEILKKMNRHYTTADYQKLVKKIRKRIPEAAISTDIIVGFPGETEKEFQNTARLMEKCRFDMAYLAQYSPRLGTAAYRLKDNVAKKEKKRREQILNEILRQTALSNNQKYLGQIVAVLIDKTKNDFLIGKTRAHKTVKIKAPTCARPRDLLGQIVSVKITAVLAWGLKGELA